MRPVALLFVVLLFSQCSKPDSSDQNLMGSAAERQLFEAARSKATQLLEKVTTLQPIDVLSPNAETPARVVAWYAANRSALLADIAGTPAYQWLLTNTNGNCRQTDARPGAPITLSYQDCQTLLSEGDALIQIIGASIEHLGGAAMTSMLEVSLRHAWDRSMNPGIPADSSSHSKPNPLTRFVLWMLGEKPVSPPKK